MKTLFVSLLVLACSATPASAGDIDACKYLLVSDLAQDKFSLAMQLREQGAAQGFTVVSSQAEVPPADAFKICVIVGSWLGNVELGQLALRVIDAASGAPIASANIGGRNWWGLARTVRDAVAKVYAQLQYSGFNEDVYQARIRRLYPPRPTQAVSESWLKSWKPRHPIEGIWIDSDKLYRLAIVPASAGMPGTHVAVVLQSGSPLWQPGEIKAEFAVKAPTEPVTATFFMMNKQALATTFTLRDDDVMQAALNTPAGVTEFVLTRESPSAAAGK